MSQIRWPEQYQETPPTGRVVVVPRTPDYDHPYSQRIPHPPAQRNRPRRQPTVTVVTPPPAPRRSVARFGLFLTICIIITICGTAYYVMTGNYDADYQQTQAVRHDLRDAPVLTFEEETPGQFVKTLDINSVRLAADQSRASINGVIYKVGDVIDAHHGLVFAGHDPDGEYLLFRDADNRVHLFSLFQE